MTSSKLQIGMAGIVVLVALRLMIGWHFYKEGAKKFTDPDFTASSFLQISHGPMAPLFKGMIADRFGLIRLDKDRMLAEYAAYKDRVANFYQFDEEQRKKADEAFKLNEKRISLYFDTIEADLYEFRNEIKRLGDAKADTVTRDVEYRRQWIATKERELVAKPKQWLAEIATARDLYEQDLAKIADEKQIQRGTVSLPDPSRMTLLNTVVKWTVILVGVSLLLGLFTRVFSLVGAGFLFSIILSQCPGFVGSEPVYYQAIEMVALLLLMVTGAGRFAGLDYFLEPIFSPFCKRFCFCCPTQGTDHESNA